MLINVNVEVPDGIDECQRARQKVKDTGSKYHEGYADAFDIAEQTSINI